MLSRRTLLVGGVAVMAIPAQASAGQVEPAHSAPAVLDVEPAEWLDLWPSDALDSPSRSLVETVEERSADPSYRNRALHNVARPRMAIFKPMRPNGASVLLIPGGGYGWVVIDKEGFELARLLSAQGVTAFVLFYRLPHQGWREGPNVALADAQRAVRLIRHRREQYGLDPGRLCAMGFSAGGHVCAGLIAQFGDAVYQPVDAADSMSARPDAAAPIYPVISMSAPYAHAGSRARLVGERAGIELERRHSPHLHVRDDSPPCFLLHAEDDDSVPVENSLMLRQALRERGVAAETHLFANGGHGFGIRLARGTSAEGWPDHFVAWARHRSLW